MSWILRTLAGVNAEEQCAQLWDAGTSGIAEVVEDGVAILIAGFDSREAALQAQAKHEGSIEPVDAAWTNAPESSVRVGERRITVSSGQAFGHGGHPTTALMLAGLPELVAPGQRVLDFGTGTGVLALAAKVLGAREVVALDNSTKALEMAAANAEANQLDVHVVAALDSLDGTFDLILANVLLPVHEAVSHDLAKRLTSGGRVLAAGITNEQRARLEHAYAPLPVAWELQRTDWIALLFGD